MLAIIIVVLAIVFYFRNIYVVNQTSEQDSSKLQVTASFYPLWYFISVIGGDKVQVYNLTPAGAEPHEYELSTQDIVRIEDSPLLIINGGVEQWADKVAGLVDANKVSIVVAGKGLSIDQSLSDKQSINDPHIWLDPILAKQEVQAITDGLVAVDSINADYYKSNQQQLIAKLDNLDNDLRHGLSSCRLHDFVTAHQAFGYLAKRYDLNQVAISGISTEAEPSAQQLAVVADFAKANNIKYIFFESLVSPKLAQTLATEVGAKTLVLDPLEGLSQKDIESGRDYFSVMRDNLANLQIALECTK